MDASILRDERVSCLSLMSTMTISAYLDLVGKAYEDRGGLKHQRDALKTTSGRRIRNRMVEDIKRGAVLPPLVIGVVVPRDQFEAISKADPTETYTAVQSAWATGVSIIDGMQRTTALIDAVEQDKSALDKLIRIECWVAQATDSLIYRMLVLNTGQVPWNLKRQLEVVYSPLVAEMKEKVQFERLFTIDKPERRTKGGEFNADSLVEAYLAFGLRRTDIDTQETLADEFSRLDMAEAIASEKYSHYFYPIVQSLVDVDKAFSRLDSTESISDTGTHNAKFSAGRNIFDSQPARIGFTVACALSVLGRLGMDRSDKESAESLDIIRAGVAGLVEFTSGLSSEQLANYLALDVLSEKMGGQKRSAVGRHERAFFETAFKVLIEEKFDVPSMEVCWRA